MESLIPAGQDSDLNPEQHENFRGKLSTQISKGNL